MKKLLPILAIIALASCSKRKSDWKCETSITTSGKTQTNRIDLQDKSKAEMEEIVRLNTYDKNGVKSSMTCKRGLFK